jgi:hypothetical protein
MGRKNIHSTVLPTLVMSAACQDAPTAPVQIQQSAVITGWGAGGYRGEYREEADGASYVLERR